MPSTTINQDLPENAEERLHSLRSLLKDIERYRQKSHPPCPTNIAGVESVIRRQTRGSGHSSNSATRLYRQKLVQKETKRQEILERKCDLYYKSLKWLIGQNRSEQRQKTQKNIPSKERVETNVDKLRQQEVSAQNRSEQRQKTQKNIPSKERVESNFDKWRSQEVSAREGFRNHNSEKAKNNFQASNPLCSSHNKLKDVRSPHTDPEQNYANSSHNSNQKVIQREYYRFHNLDAAESKCLGINKLSQSYHNLKDVMNPHTEPPQQTTSPFHNSKESLASLKEPSILTELSPNHPFSSWKRNKYNSGRTKSLPENGNIKRSQENLIVQLRSAVLEGASKDPLTNNKLADTVRKALKENIPWSLIENTINEVQHTKIGDLTPNLLQMQVGSLAYVVCLMGTCDLPSLLTKLDAILQEHKVEYAPVLQHFSRCCRIEALLPNIKKYQDFIKLQKSLHIDAILFKVELIDILDLIAGKVCVKCNPSALTWTLNAMVDRGYVILANEYDLKPKKYVSLGLKSAQNYHRFLNRLLQIPDIERICHNVI